MSNINLLNTDLYQATMGYGYWFHNLHERDACFYMYFRRHPFGGNYTIAAGLEQVIDFLNNFKFDPEDLDYLSSLKTPNGNVLFPQEYLTYLKDLKFSCDVNAVPEGTVVFPQEPLVRVSGPLLQCQWVETAILNIINYQTLIATKAHRICKAALERPVIEFGLRRAYSLEGGLWASRAAYIGGCAGTSNLRAGKEFGIPVKGTQAHSWCLAFGNAEEAFRKYADAMPDNCSFLIDTFDVYDDTDAAVKVGKDLRTKGFNLNAVRLDSGDLDNLVKDIRMTLDIDGFNDTKIIVSNDLDEYVISHLNKNHRIDMFGVGTKLVVPETTLGGVYKLSAIKDESGVWQKRFKSAAGKQSLPGLLRTIRTDDADIIVDEDEPNAEYLDQPIFRAGELVARRPSLDEIREKVKCSFDSIKRLDGYRVDVSDSVKVTTSNGKRT